MNAPFQSFAGEEAYPSLHQKAARLCFGLVRNHPFVDGNKRIGAHAMLVFLALNGVELDYTREELSSVILSWPQGRPAMANCSTGSLNIRHSPATRFRLVGTDPAKAVKVGANPMTSA